MHQKILTLFVSALPDIIRLGALTTTNIKCLSSENDIRKSEILHPINYLEKNSFLYDYKSGCSNVATWKGAGIYLCHDKPSPLTIDSLEIGRLAHEGNHRCWMSHFQAEILTAQNITVLLSRPR